jgi:hypothetical protein
MNTNCTTKQITIPAMTSSMVTTKFNGETLQDKTYIATIHCPGTPMITGVPAVVSINENNNCKVMIENCAPYDVTIETNDLMELVDIEEDELIPDAVISRYLKNSMKNTLISCSNTRKPSASTNTTLDWPKTTSTRFISKPKSRSTESNSKFPRLITSSLRGLWKNGSN